MQKHSTAIDYLRRTISSEEELVEMVDQVNLGCLLTTTVTMEFIVR